MADKKTELSIILRTVDRATAGIKAVNAVLDRATKPVRDFKEALGELREKSGLDDVIGGFKGVGSAVGDLLSKMAAVAGIAGVAVAGLFHLVGEFDDLGDKAERLGVGVDFLASMRYAAEKAGAPVEALDTGVQSFSQSLGQLRAGTGRMKSFLDKVNPAFERQLKGAKSNEEAFDMLADAMAKVTDPAKRAALAQKTVGDAALAPLLAKGAKGMKELRDGYLDLAGSQQGAADKAGAVDDSLHDLHAATDGVKAALVEGLAPALKTIVEQLRDWLKGHRADLKEWAAALGKKIPAAVSTLVDWVKSALATIGPFLDSIGGIKTVAIALAAVLAGPLIAAVASLGVALLTTPIGWVLAGLAGLIAVADGLSKGGRVLIPVIVGVGAALLGLPGVGVVAGITAAAALVIKYWGPISDFFGVLWDGVKSVFSAAWDFISGIVDKVVAAVDKVINAAKSVGRFISHSDVIDAGLNLNADVPDIGAQAEQNAGAGGRSTDAKVTVDFANAPRGTRAKVDPQSTGDVDLSIGYQMWGTP